MATARLSVFDKTLQESNLWLKALMESLGTTNRDTAYDALKATLHTLRDRIGPGNAVHLGAQLPMLIRGLYYDGWRPATTPTKERHTADFLDHLSEKLARNSRTDPEAAARAVFYVMWQKIDSGEVAKLLRVLPAELRELWVESKR
jgi:uncharacterized protein (DUF2267 family)